MTVAGAVRGVIVRPLATFASLRQAPRWLGVMTVATTLSAVSWAVLYSTEIGRIALVDQWERTAFALGQELDDQGYARLQQISTRGVEYSVGRALVLGPGVTVVVGLIVLAVSRRLSPDAPGPTLRPTMRPTLRQSLAIAAHAGVVLALRDLTAAPLAYVRETTASATTLGQWLPLLDEASTAARLAGSLDVFVLWWAALIGVGTAVLCERSPRRTAAAAMGTFAAGASVTAGVIGLVGGGR